MNFANQNTYKKQNSQQTQTKIKVVDSDEEAFRNSELLNSVRTSQELIN